MAAIESHGAYPESPLDPEDVVYPCKGCGEILEEGKAFELAGNRWHIDCFRCNTCRTLLDSDANLLLLGDGSLICNNCTYSCHACGNKIEDLAILTGDQAFCSGCFRCRNCKRKIDNLRYARTSQGIFCMSCHESLMARRRKKGKTPKSAATSNRPEKALPSLPPGAAHTSAFTPEVGTPEESHSETHTPQLSSPRESLNASQNGGPRASLTRRDISPLADGATAGGPMLSSGTYNDKRSGEGSTHEDDDGEERGILHMAFDPTPVAGPPPISIPRKQLPRSTDASPPQSKENLSPRDYFQNNNNTPRPSGRSAVRDVLREDRRPGSSRSVSTDRDTHRLSGQPKISPHILYQDKGRNMRSGPSGSSTPLAESMSGSPVIAGISDKTQTKAKAPDGATGADVYDLGQSGTFTLQDVPKSRRKSSAMDLTSDDAQPSSQAQTKKSPGSPSSLDDVNPFDDPKRKEAAQVPSALSSPVVDRSLPLRGDSLNTALLQTKQTKLDAPSPRTMASSTSEASPHARHVSASSIPSPRVTDAAAVASRDNAGRTQPVDRANSVRQSLDGIPARAAARQNTTTKASTNDNFTAPRLPPALPIVTPATAVNPALEKHRHHESISTMQSERSDAVIPPPLGSAGLPRFSSDGGFSMEDELVRILRGDTRDRSTDASTPSVLRRVSNAVKHGRTFSDRETPKNARTPTTGSMDIAAGDSTTATPSSGGDSVVEQLRTALRRTQQRNADLEAERLALQERLDGASDMKTMNTELTKKRETMSELDRQREVVMRELVIMAENLKKSKDSNQPFDLGSLKTVVLKEFADSLQELKDSLGPQIEELIRKRNELTTEIASLIQMKDKGFQEYDNLSSKNAQLIQHNNELLRNIKEMYNDNRQPSTASGLGIFNASSRGDGSSTADRSQSLAATDSSMSNLLQENEAQPATVLEGPQVLTIRKGIATKFNWRKGGEKMAKNVTKGLKGAFAGADRGPEPGQYSIGMPYNQVQIGGANMDPNGINARREADGKGFGFFGQKNGNLKTGNGLGHMKNNSNNNLIASDGSTLFGSELSLRCEFENRLIPSLVTRCIQEVESRGMEVEGVYRKSGGAGQVKQVQQGFERDTDFDISDPDLDIHAITSTLKQYFRKLPTPLIAYDVYDRLLEAGQISSDAEKQALALRVALAELPDAHRDTLQYLIQHLARVMAHEPANLMTPLNLAVVFAPTIMRPASIEREMTDMQSQRVAVQALLEHHQDVFESDT